jgi:hypothetical protein
MKASDDAPPDFPAGAGPVRLVLVLDVLGRTVRVDAARHAEVLAALAAWERRDRGSMDIPIGPTPLKRVTGGGNLFGG